MTDYKPQGFHTITPYLIVDGAAKLIAFLERAFDAQVLGRDDRPDGTVLHSEIRIGDSMLELADATAQWPGRPVSLHMYVPDADALYARALASGAQSLYEPSDKFYGDREAGIIDPSGNQWFLATHKHDPAQQGASS